MLMLREQFKKVGHLKPRLHVENTSENISESLSSDIIESRLEKMDAELDTKIMECDSLLNGMALALALQVESNHYTKRDSDTSIIIARLAHQEGNQMKMMSLVGMIFLPGTFLATLFSMSFFRWLPDDSPQMVSPYVAIYFGLTVVITAMTVFFWRWSNKKANDPLLEKVVNGVIDPDDLERGPRGLISSKKRLDQGVSTGAATVETQMLRRYQ
ncbi:hypothetical protein E8E14_005129 [Neopestalotiopsis sp. 37M]|nr:hypothetical protein E8E14_005129 [Neopestalotiopsis sp. 37M]